MTDTVKKRREVCTCGQSLIPPGLNSPVSLCPACGDTWYSSGAHYKSSQTREQRQEGKKYLLSKFYRDTPAI
jgi:predicted RNA-binding Zn-ribbon protein involved in translation (DUF1610 family)